MPAIKNAIREAFAATRFLANYSAGFMDDWHPPRYYRTLKGAHKDRYRYGTAGLTLYEWKNGEWIKRPWRDDLPSDRVPK
jgi:hypothetical protein